MGPPGALLVGLALGLGAPVAATAHAPGPAGPAPQVRDDSAPSSPGDRLLRGRLLVGDVAADSGTVVLHRVTPEEAGPVDSVRVDHDGSFLLTLPTPLTSGSGEVYFASSRREGVLYYGQALTAPGQLAEPYRIRTWPTRSAEAGRPELSVAARTVFLEEGTLGWRVTDLIEVRNDDGVTWVPGEGGAPVWRYPLPPAARAARTAEGEVAPDAVRFRDGAIELVGPVIPGGRLVVIRYEVEEVAFELPMPGRTDAVEVLVREPAAPVHPEGLAARPAATLEAGSRYRRWTGEGRVDAVLRIREGSGERVPLDPGWLVVAVALLLAAIGIVVVLRGGTDPAGGPPEPEG